MTSPAVRGPSAESSSLAVEPSEIGLILKRVFLFSHRQNWALLLRRVHTSGTTAECENLINEARETVPTCTSWFMPVVYCGNKARGTVFDG